MDDGKYVVLARFDDKTDQKLMHSKFDIMLPSLGIFPPGGEYKETAVLYASPTQTKHLVDFYYAFHEKLDEHCGDLGWFYSA